MWHPLNVGVGSLFVIFSNNDLKVEIVQTKRVRGNFENQQTKV